MGDVEELLESTTGRFERVTEMAEEAESEYERIESLASLLGDTYAEGVSDLRGEVAALQSRIDDVERHVDAVRSRLPSLAQADSFESLRSTVNEVAFEDLVSRDEFARKYC